MPLVCVFHFIFLQLRTWLMGSSLLRMRVLITIMMKLLRGIAVTPLVGKILQSLTPMMTMMKRRRKQKNLVPTMTQVEWNHIKISAIH